ncbi:hypothetical protein K8T06_01405 [bacterium]|nr:hypothetical protein [bacterium]
MKSLKIMIVSLIFSVSAYAGTIHVPADYPTIQAAIDAALPKDQILVDSGIYIENLDFMGKEIMLQSKDGPENTTIEALCPRPVFIIFNVPGENALLEGFRITGGRASIGGGIRMENSTITIRNNIIENNIAIGDIVQGIDAMGGGIYSLHCPAIFESNIIQNNQAIVPDTAQTEETQGASALGGGLYVLPGNCRIYNCSINSNSAIGGTVRTEVTAHHSADAYAGHAFGGGLCIIGRIFQVGDHILECNIQGNIARGGDAESWYDSDAYGGDAWGAGVYIERSWENNFVDCLFSNNKSTGGLAESLHGKDKSSYGGQVYGGALSCLFSEYELNIQRCVFTDNISTGGIGLLYYLPGIDPVHDIDGASFGGAVYSGGATGFLIENSVFNSNSIADDNKDSMGSSFFAETSADCVFATIINSSGASAIESPESTNIHNLISCIVYFNEDGPGTFQAEFSDIEGGASGNSNFDADPEFKDNHGFHISGISPCIDTGKTYSLDHDIDGDFRPFFLGYDVGADEYTGTLPTATPTITPTPDPSFSPMTNMFFMATPSPPPTATPSEISVLIVLPRHYVIECDLFWVDVKLWNPDQTQSGIHLVVALEYQENFWFLPSWSLFDPDTGEGFDAFLLDHGLQSGLEIVNVLPKFQWPGDNTQNFTGATFYAALLSADMSEILGNLDIESWTFRY